VTEKLRALFEGTFTDGTGQWTARNAYIWEIRDADIHSSLSLMGLTINGCVPDTIVVTDESGTEVGTESQGTGGFSAVVITATNVTVVLGYSA
jgi:hypothetical protein